MKLSQFHHGIRAARMALQHQGATGAMVIMGSQAILASYRVAALNSALLMSAEMDIMPVAGSPDEIDRLSDHLAPLGQDSHFQEQFGFHVDGISIDTSVLAPGWVDRLIPEIDPTSGATAWCLDVHDLAVAKLIAGRDKDLDFVRLLVSEHLVDPDQIIEALKSVNDPRVSMATTRMRTYESSGIPPEARPAWRSRRRRAVAARLTKTTEPSPAAILEGVEQILAGRSQPESDRRWAGPDGRPVPAERT